MDEEFELRKKAARDYESKHLDQFVVIDKQDDSKVIGVFKELTPDFLLFIEGKHGSWRVDPLEIVSFYGREDKFKNIAIRGDENL